MKRKRIKWSAKSFGSMSNEQLAKRLGIELCVVATARKRYERCIKDRLTMKSPNEALVKELKICRDDRCDRVEIHEAHSIRSTARDPFYDPGYGASMNCWHRSVLRDITLKHLTTRRCKPFRELLNDVRNDYGDGKWLSRALYRTLNDLRNTGEVVSIRLPTDNASTPGGYVRGDSPLLNDDDGKSFLQETLEDTRPTMW
jgi:hypothetical protein